MARRLRIEYPGAIYHAMNRGDRREAIFRDDADRFRFLDTLGECCEKTEWQIHAYGLMSNHFHLVLETPIANLVAGMKWFLGTYTGRFNRRHRLVGHLFAGRYEALIVDGSGNGYLRTVCDYVHLNPVRAGLIGPEVALRSWPWSSLPAYLRAPSLRPPWLRVDRLFGELGFQHESRSARKALERNLEQRRGEDTEAAFEAIRRGWFLGDEDREEALLQEVAQRFGEHHYGEERERSSEVKATRILGEELNRRGWTNEELVVRRKGDPTKLEIAERLRKETTVSLKWIAQRLHLGHWTYLNTLLARRRRSVAGSKD